MFEFLFFVTALYLGYVAKEAYQAVNRAEKGEPVFKEKTPPAKAEPLRAQAAPAKVAQAPKPAVVPAPAPAPAAPKEAEKTSSQASLKKAAATPKAAPAAKAQAKSAPKSKAQEAKLVLADDLKNPETGEVTPVPANYRFAKKWIKDALVAEKLLDRVYKPSELDGATSLKVKEALDKLRGMKRYQA